ncbi:hypothetical protein WMZ97_17015 [Lentibacillus sp. N15]|uniref:hypothetical protein n=1 Tax=Lentibacillus songyuanensis TaxID=3136161 RepID=UPI0031BAA787
MEKMTIGIIAAPDLPASTAEVIKDDLPDAISTITWNQMEWNVETQISPLAGAAEKISDILAEAKKLREKYRWDYAICLTDLPVFSGKNVVLADVSVNDGVAHISLPAFGALPTPKRIKNTVVKLVKELYIQCTVGAEKHEMRTNGIGPINKEKNKGAFKKLKEVLRFHPFFRVSSPTVEGVGVRFIIRSKLNGWAFVLLGMAIANRPWTIMPSFKGVVALAFASGAYGLIFPTLWQLSMSYNLPRFFGLMFASILAMLVWIVFAHNLWERPSQNTTSHLRMLYNTATIITLLFSILLYYLVLFALFLLAVSIFVPPDLFGFQSDQNVGVHDYLKLAWLVTSVATVAGSIGSGLEKTEVVGKVTYGYRQYLRYEQAKQDEKEEESDKYGKAEDN